MLKLTKLYTVSRCNYYGSLIPNDAVLYKNENRREIGKHLVYRELLIFTIKTDKGIIAQERLYIRESFLNERYSVYLCWLKWLKSKIYDTKENVVKVRSLRKRECWTGLWGTLLDICCVSVVAGRVYLYRSVGMVVKVVTSYVCSLQKKGFCVRIKDDVERLKKIEDVGKNRWNEPKVLKVWPLRTSKTFPSKLCSHSFYNVIFFTL